jgi:hypothetical protein
MIVLLLAVLLGTVLAAILGWLTDMWVLALLSPLIGNFCALGAAILLYAVASRDAGAQRDTMRVPPPGVVWC